MWNPFARKEVRASYTDSLVNLLVRQASGGALGQASATAAVEAAIGAWGRAFAGCQIAPQVDALDPFTLSRIARDLLLDGESLHVIEVAAGGLRILPVGDHDISGSGPDPDEWIYSCSLHGPSGSVTRSVPSAGVIHIRYSVDPSRPWKGVGPLKRAGLDADLLSALTTRMAEEAGASSALVIPSPVDGAADSTTTLRSDLAKARGGLLMVESMAPGYGDRAAAPTSDWSVKRLGSMIPDANETIRGAVGLSIASALGVPISLLTDADGVSQRESWRRFIWGSVAPLARVIGHELSSKLDLPTDLKFDFSALYASGITGRAAATRRLVEAGMSISEAASITGLVAADDG